MLLATGTLLTGLNPDTTSKAQAAYKLVSFIPGTVKVAAPRKIVREAGYGPCFTIIIVLCLSNARFLILPRASQGGTIGTVEGQHYIHLIKTGCS